MNKIIVINPPAAFDNIVTTAKSYYDVQHDREIVEELKMEGIHDADENLRNLK